MHKNCATVLVSLLAAATLPVMSASAQKMPRSDVIDIPAIAPGLCVSNVFQTNMVLQRDKPIAVWGWATPGERVTVSFGGSEQAANAGDDRTWKVVLPAMPANANPQRMTVAGSSASHALENILLGDVWVLGGQSNMEFELAKVENGALEIVSANFPQIRILTVPFAEGPEVCRGFPRLHEWSAWFGRHFRKGDWDVCTPKVARELSAIGYAFARRVHKASNVPIGVVDASRGGSAVETWLPTARLRAMDDENVRSKLADWQRRVDEWDSAKDLEQRVKSNSDWVARQTKAGKPVPEDRLKDPSDLLPGPIADFNHPGHCYAGMIAPLVGMAVKGVIFHQGYNNTFDGMPGIAMYRAVLPEMIRAWREAFGDSEMPFGILSLCTDGYPQTDADYVEKMFNTGIYVRAVQYQTFLDMWQSGDKNVGFASTYDLRRRWYHPQVKVPAGERMARWALATQYGFARELRWQPPLLLATEVRDGTLVLRFDSEVNDPEDGAIVGFAIAGEDRRFQPATAVHLQVGKDNRGKPRFDRKQLVLSSPLVAAPTHFRYAWGRNPLANLQATSNLDLPLATQRSDDWSMAAVPLDILKEEVEGKMTRAQSNLILKALRSEDLRRRLDEAQRYVEQHKPR